MLSSHDFYRMGWSDGIDLAEEDLRDHVDRSSDLVHEAHVANEIRRYSRKPASKVMAAYHLAVARGYLHYRHDYEKDRIWARRLSS